MKKRKRILILLLLIIITIVVLLIYNKLYYSKKEILSIINRSNETFNNIYIKFDSEILQDNEKRIEESYAKDNVIYTDTYMYDLLSDNTTKVESSIWNLETKERLYINHTNKTINTSTIRGKRTS